MDAERDRLADNSTNVADSTMLCIFTKSISCLVARCVTGGVGVGGIEGCSAC